MSDSVQFEIENHFNWIETNLAVGDIVAGSHSKRWEYFGAIVNLSEIDTGTGPGSYLWLPIKDGDVTAFSKVLDSAIKFIEDNLHKKVLVHCNAGVSRSPSVVLAYLCRKNPPSSRRELLELYYKIKRARPAIFPFQGFIDEIAALYNVPPIEVGW